MTNENFTSFASKLLQHANDEPERRALVCDGAQLNYGELIAKARACAGRLQALGLAPGGEQRVAVVASNSLDFAVVIVACQLLGVAIVPLPGLITADAQARMIDDANAVVLFHDYKHLEQARMAGKLTAHAEKLSLVPIGPAPQPQNKTGSMLDQWLAAEASAFTPRDAEADWPSDLIYSSGTTGMPKGIVQSYHSRAAQSVSLANLAGTDRPNILHTISLYSNFGISAFYLSLWCGGTYFMLGKFSADTTVAYLQDEQIDMAWFAPATLIRSVEAPGFEAAVSGTSCVKLCAGAPLSKAQKQNVLASWAGPFYEIYGQTETGTLSLLAMHAVPESKLGSVGTLLPTTAVRILDNDGRELPVNTEGEIAGHSTTLMTGYNARSDANAVAFWKDKSGLLYVRTGDVGRLDADGFLWLCDRKKDMIISGGFNVFPADIEEVLQGHPVVFEVAVVGYESARWGETPVAFVTLRDQQNVTEGELLQWANARLGDVQRMAMVKILPDLPRGTMGKILKRQLRDEYAGALGKLP